MKPLILRGLAFLGHICPLSRGLEPRPATRAVVKNRVGGVHELGAALLTFSEVSATSPSRGCMLKESCDIRRRTRPPGGAVLFDFAQARHQRILFERAKQLVTR